jgi:GNAT superfamily N-acetyltransferase
MTYKIRTFDSNDIDSIVELGHVMHQEGAYHWLPYDRDKLRKLAQNLLETGKGQVWIAELPDRKKIGMYAAYKTQYFFCQETQVIDLLMYVHPDHRNNGFLPIRLIKKATEWAKQQGAREFCPASSVSLSSDRVEKLYNFMKFDTVGHLFKKRIS